jgi:hypothetical protein
VECPFRGAAAAAVGAGEAAIGWEFLRPHVPRDLTLRFVRRPLVLSKQQFHGRQLESRRVPRASHCCAKRVLSFRRPLSRGGPGGTQRPKLVQEDATVYEAHRSTANEELGAAAPSQELHVQLQARHALSKKPCLSTTGNSHILPRSQSSNSTP